MVAWARLPLGVRNSDLYGSIVAALPRQAVRFVACVTSRVPSRGLGQQKNADGPVASKVVPRPTPKAWLAAATAD
jgi:hypothetical protein